MATVINVKGMRAKAPRTSDSIELIRSFLPWEVLCEIDKILESLPSYESIEEIRLRSGRRAYLTLGGGTKRNFALNTVTQSAELSEILERMCDGSLYAYSESITKGYISLGGGVRVGVCGKASVEGGRILGIYDISALNVRLPRRRADIDASILARIRQSLDKGEGVLVYSPPAQGKTTFLRSLAYILAEGKNALRVSVVDTQDELVLAFDNELLALEVLSGYPKDQGIRIATAFMNPQVIICDEIGDALQAQAIADAQNCGVPLIASAHGASVEGILQRKGMRTLHECGAFGIYVGIRIGKGGGFEYTLRRRAEIDAEDNGNSLRLP